MTAPGSSPHAPIDRLAEAGSPSDLVILNYGDPAYRHQSDLVAGLSRSENIFLRIVAYLVFAESVSVPTRHILEGDDMAQAIVWLSPLLEEGILIPERRAGASSFEDVARIRNLPQLSLRRAEFLDRHSTKIRSFQFDVLSATYVDLLNSDLDMGGAFRRTVDGGISGKYASAISAAHDDHLAYGDGNPERFVHSVAKFAPKLRTPAWRWAMARYYTTPLAYDSANTREIPASAAKLLFRGRVIDSAASPFARAAPVDSTYQRLAAKIPADNIATSSRDYCEALLEVRRAIPDARRIFADVREASQLKDAGDSLSAQLEKELARQQGIRPGKGRLFTLVSSLLGTGAGAMLGFVAPGGAESIVGLGGGVLLGLGSGIGSNELYQRFQERHDLVRRPWVLAMDRLERDVD